MGVAETKEAIDKAALAFKSWSKTTAKVILMPMLPVIYFLLSWTPLVLRRDGMTLFGIYTIS